MSADHPPILALHATSKGFGFVVMSGPFSLIDWGRKIATKDKNSVSLAKLEKIVDQYNPHVIVLEDSSQLAKRCDRIDRLYLAISTLCLSRSIDLAVFPRQHIYRVYATVGAKTWQDIAEAVSRQLEPLKGSVPLPRKAWQSEHPRMAIFTAAALAMVYWQLSGTQDFAAQLDDA